MPGQLAQQEVLIRSWEQQQAVVQEPLLLHLCLRSCQPTHITYSSNRQAVGLGVSSSACGTLPVEMLPKQLGAQLADAPAQAQGWHPVDLLQLVAVLLMMVRCMQMDAEALWRVVPSGDCLAALQQ